MSFIFTSPSILLFTWSHERSVICCAVYQHVYQYVHTVYTCMRTNLGRRIETLIEPVLLCLPYCFAICTSNATVCTINTNDKGWKHINSSTMLRSQMLGSYWNLRQKTSCSVWISPPSSYVRPRSEGRLWSSLDLEFPSSRLRIAPPSPTCVQSTTPPSVSSPLITSH